MFVDFLTSEGNIACNQCIFSRSAKSDNSAKGNKSQGSHHAFASNASIEDTVKKEYLFSQRFCREKAMDDRKDFVRLKHFAKHVCGRINFPKDVQQELNVEHALRDTQQPFNRTGIGTNTEDTISDDSNDYRAFNA